jgi:tripartite ATP-independent transporter DctM subunit
MSTISSTAANVRAGLQFVESGVETAEAPLRWILKVVSIVALIGIAILINVNVFTRYVLGFTLPWPSGLSVLLNIYITYVGGAIAYYVGDHVSVQYFQKKFPDDVSRALTVFINALVILLGVAMLWFGTELAWSQKDSETIYLGISLFWSRIPLAIGGFYIVLEAGRRVIETMLEDIEAGTGYSFVSFVLSIAIGTFVYFAGVPFPGGEILEIVMIFVFLITMIVLNVPIAFAMSLSALLFLLFFPNALDILKPVLVIQQMGQAISGFSILAIPMFIYAGRLMTITGITGRIIDFANLLVGRMRAGLSHVNVVTSMLFAGISGSAVADTAAVGSILIPAMKDEGYETGYTCAITCSSSIIGPIIPPSIIMIIFAITVPSVGVAAIFMAGVVPGILFGLGLMVATYIVGWRTGWEKFPDVEKRERPTRREAFSIVKDASLALVMPLIIIGGILSGAFTATEAGAVAVGYTMIVGVFVYREIDWESFVKASYRTVTMSGVTLFIIGAAKPITQVMAIKAVPDEIANVLLATTQDPTMMILLIVGILAVLAMFIESIANILLWAPVFAPLVVEVGADPLHFAIVMIMTLAMGMITPPLGVTLFVAAPIAGTNIETIAKNLVYFFIIEAAVLLSIIFVPEIALWLPRTLGYI